MTTQTEAQVIGDVVLYEAPSRYSREEYEVDTGQTLICGELVELNGGKITELTVTEANCIGVCLANCTAGEIVPVLVRHAIVAEGQIDYGSADSESAARTQLIALGIIPRNEAT